jgi:hypothetical protein
MPALTKNCLEVHALIVKRLSVPMRFQANSCPLAQDLAFDIEIIYLFYRLIVYEKKIIIPLPHQL